MTDKTLKPCPFCWSATAPIPVRIAPTMVTVRCKLNMGGCDSKSGVAPTEDEAIAAWNKRADQAEELAALRSFALAVMDCWPDGWGIEGDELQHIATEHGMLIPEIRTDPCGDACRCAERVLPKEWIDGVVCYRKTALLTGVEK